MFNYKLILLCVFAICLVQCKEDKSSVKEPIDKSETLTVKVDVPKFDAKQAFTFVERQVAFGPRVPGSKAQDSCANWLKETLKTFGAEVQVQEATVALFDGVKVPMKNIIGSYNPTAKKRLLLCAHWDSRRVADQDSKNADKPILGADDGASGVGVLLEVARQLQAQPTDMGVDIVFFDVEDQGESGSATRPYRRETWCIGAQHWAKNPHVANYKAKFGILLDMVGSQNARFPKEGASRRYAGTYVNQVWKKASELGYSDYFVNEEAHEITDDHVFVNEILNIPTLDIINLPQAGNTTTGFGHYWHTHEDDMDVISVNTLNAVGTTILHVIYNEAVNQL